MAKLKSKLSPQMQEEQIQQDAAINAVQHRTTQHMLKTSTNTNLQETAKTVGSEISITSHRTPHYPSWPTSQPGPRTTLPLAGMHAINALRPEQVAEMVYTHKLQKSTEDVSLDTSSSSHQVGKAHKLLGKRKQRL